MLRAVIISKVSLRERSSKSRHGGRLFGVSGYDPRVKTIGLVLYPRFTALDIVGPYEVLARVPEYRTIWVAGSLEPVRADRGATITPDSTFDEMPPLDVIVVPGGPGQQDQMEDASMMAAIARAAASASHVASVCTGSLLLARAGVLRGKRATTHWLAMDALAALGAIPVAERVVRDGNVFTAAGVSAGIDLALTLAAELAGEQVARATQLGIEYDPQPPFDSGSPDRAPELAAVLRENARRFL